MWLIEETLDDGSARLIGHHGVMPFRATIGGETCLVGKTENTMVHPDHRSRILYPRFERRFLAAYEPRFAMLFSTTGPAAAIRLRKAMGYAYREPMWTDILYRGVLGGIDLMKARQRRKGTRGSTGFLATALRERRSRGVAVVPVDDAAFIEHWTAAERTIAHPGDELRFDRGPEILEWRYAQHPSGVYRGIRFEDLLVVAHLRFGHILCIDEIVTSDGTGEVSWSAVSRMMRALGHRLVQVSGLGPDRPHRDPLSRDGWRVLPRKTVRIDEATPGMPCRVTTAGAELGIDLERSGFGPLVFEGPGRGRVG